jgi:hypothetical protein
MKRFMFLSIGVLCLAIAVLIGFYVGSQKATAQTSEAQYFFTYSGGSYFHYVAILPNGDVYRHQLLSNDPMQTPAYVGNFWGGGVATDKSTWSGVKGQYNK